MAATRIFLYAREKAETSSEVAGVDATQASEVIFALIGGILGSVTYFGMDASINEFIMLVVTFAVHMLALRFDWHLPSIRLVA